MRSLARHNIDRICCGGPFSEDAADRADTGETGARQRCRIPPCAEADMFTRAPAHSGERGLPDGIKDLDFSGAHQQRVLAVACEEGSATLWDWEHAARLIKLELPEGGLLTIVSASVVHLC